MQVLPNQLVELHVETNSGLEIYRTRVEDAFDDLLIVGAPIKQGVLVPIRIGTRLQCTVPGVQQRERRPVQ